MGCQVGLNLPPGNPEPSDLPQTLVGQGASLIGNTGWGYGIVDGFGLSEVLTELLTEALVSRSSTTLGDALMEAKRAYYLDELDFDHYDEKVLAELTLYGLPMLRVQTPTNETSAANRRRWMNLDSVTKRETHIIQPLGADGQQTLQAGPVREERRLRFREDDLSQRTTPRGVYYLSRSPWNSRRGWLTCLGVRPIMRNGKSTPLCTSLFCDDLEH